MQLYSTPQPLDIFVSLVIGIASGAIVTACIFIFVIKKKWEKKWEYYNRIKSISQIRLPQIASDSALSPNEIQNTVMDNSSISDKRFLERIWADAQNESFKSQTSNESFFLTPSVYGKMSSAVDNNPSTVLNHESNIKYKRNRVNHKSPNPISELPISSTGKLFEGSSSGTSETFVRIMPSRISEDEEIPLGLKFNQIGKSKQAETSSTTVYPSHIIIAFLTGLLVGMCISLAAFYLRKLCLKQKKKSARVKKLKIASRSSLVLPQINSPSFLESIHAGVTERKGSVLRPDMESDGIKPDDEIIEIKVLNDLTQDLNLNVFMEPEEMQSANEPETTKTTDKSTNQPSTLDNMSDANEIIQEYQLYSTSIDQVDDGNDQTANNKDNSTNLPNHIDTTVASNRLGISKKVSDMASPHSQPSSKSSGVSQTESPLGMLLESAYSSASSPESNQVPDAEPVDKV